MFFLLLSPIHFHIHNTSRMAARVYQRYLFRGTTVYQHADLFLFCDFNIERMTVGRPPMCTDGSCVELHHIGQRCHLDGGKVVEISARKHWQYRAILHDPRKASSIDRDAFRAFRTAYWKQVAADSRGSSFVPHVTNDIKNQKKRA